MPAPSGQGTKLSWGLNGGGLKVHLVASNDAEQLEIVPGHRHVQIRRISIQARTIEGARRRRG